MGFAETMIFYHLIGAGVATAVFLSDPGQSGWSRRLRVATAVVFWPLYLPILLSRPKGVPMSKTAPATGGGDAMVEAIAQVEAELETALASLDGWAEGVLSRETDRFHELGSAWRAQAGRIREIDGLLIRADPAAKPPAPGPEAGERCRQSEQARQANLARLRHVRCRAYEDLMGTLAWVRELVSMIHLAKFTGAPASRAEELVAQIAAAIEGISAVTWQDAAADSSGPAKRPISIPIRSQTETDPCNYSSASATSSPQI
jgi:hypothetical protein